MLGAVGMVARAVTGKTAKKLLKKAIGFAGGAIAGVGLEKALPFGQPLFPGMAGGGGGFGHDWGKVGKGIFGSSKGRIAAGDMGACPRGYHLNKHRLTDGTQPHTVCVRNRSINFANGRAARRAGRRLRGTVKMLKKSFTFVSAHRPKGKFVVRKK
jgi:hypothetical protein